MKTLVIHPKDISTDFLSIIYKDIDCTIIRNSDEIRFIGDEINNHERVIMLGHGSNVGLYGFGNFIIDSSYAKILKCKRCIFIWCNSDEFVRDNNLSGFYTGMIISEIDEAYLYSVSTNNKFIDKSNICFAELIRQSIDSLDMLRNVKMLYRGQSSVIKFNRNNLFEKY